jgi:protein-L-isoaspartate(D-aspartate) O-methyltransferase
MSGAFLPLVMAAAATAGPASDAPATQPAKALTWQRPRLEERQRERNRMVDAQMRPHYALPVTGPTVLAALRHVPRHKFVPKSVRSAAYADRPLPIGYGQTISQPYIVGLMTQALKIKPGGKVLEVGTGSGYQAAVLSELTPHVYSIEIVDALGRQAAKRFKQLGYKTIRTKVADGYYGWKQHAPYDAIIVTCAAAHVPRPLFDQLAPGGVMCIPVGSRWGMQRLYLVEKTAKGKMRSRSMLSVAFVPLTGGHDGKK